ncbi:hypothetical protein BGZ57DRAFT_1008778 [Hyaloscypha finlandica]|nr:hypothetical protein BGZ57DRAFT_1008778 [Hyaloscypha finlandica]
MLDYNVLKGIIVQSMYGTFYWPLLTALPDMLITGNTKDALPVLIEFAGGTSVTDESKQVVLGVRGIHCADRTVLEDERQEVYLVDFHAKTKKPVLFIGYTGDGFTPLASAYNVSSGFKDSVVPEVNGYGHSSLAVPSTFDFNILSTYWLNGTFRNLTSCEVQGAKTLP